MKIPIKVEFFAGGLRPMIACSLRSTNPTFFGFINAIIDTGSPTTILGISDVQKMRLSQVQMKKFIGEEKEVNLGGAQMKTKILENANIRIGNSINITLPVQVPVKITKGVSPPTIIGVDFLQKANLGFFFNPNKKESYLEKQEE